ncbi:MarR family transcriptional regulator [Agromyces mediolanus]|uniref:MarR family winged helix-turn-helix transcriptional regulator n=1 Tax=Agromyces mediolanus TaxID=41986 RepID=UPI0038397D89
MHTDDPAALLDSVRTVIRLARIAQQACEEAGLNLAQYRALNSARDAGRRAYELAQATAVTRPAVTSLTNGMVKAGLIARESSKTDGRGVVFVVTEYGSERLREAEALLLARFREVLGDAVGALEALDTIPLELALDEQVDRDFGARA